MTLAPAIDALVDSGGGATVAQRLTRSQSRVAVGGGVSSVASSEVNAMPTAPASGGGGGGGGGGAMDLKALAALIVLLALRAAGRARGRLAIRGD